MPYYCDTTLRSNYALCRGTMPTYFHITVVPFSQGR